ncbi:MAG: hypothetical protein K0U98_11325 [Deltaproteobacteria bacterium]|nr:hypothetical protein [Deltaproteobacteria bacterium]
MSGGATRTVGIEWKVINPQTFAASAKSVQAKAKATADALVKAAKDAGKTGKELDEVRKQADKLKKEMSGGERIIKSYGDGLHKQRETLNRLTAAAKKGEAQYHKTRTAIIAEQRALAAGVRITKKQVDALGELILEEERIQRELRETARAFDRQGESIGRSSKGIGLLKGALAGISLLAVARNVARTGIEFERLQTVLETVEGSSTRAAASFALIKEFAAKTPFEVKNLVEAYTLLLSVGITPTERRLTSFGNTASAFGRDITDFSRAVVGAVSGETEALKSFGIVARTQGDTVRLSFRGVTTEVGRNAEEITGYLENIGLEAFAGGMDRMAGTSAGALSNLQDAWDGLAAAIFNTGLDDGLKVVVSTLSDLLNRTTEVIEGFGGLEGAAARASALIASGMAVMARGGGAFAASVLDALSRVQLAFFKTGTDLVNSPLVQFFEATLPGYSDAVDKVRERFLRSGAVAVGFADSADEVRQASELAAIALDRVADDQWRRAVEASNRTLADTSSELDKAGTSAGSAGKRTSEFTGELERLIEEVGRLERVNQIMRETGASAEAAAQAVKVLLSGDKTTNLPQVQLIQSKINELLEAQKEIARLGAERAAEESQAIVEEFNRAVDRIDPIEIDFAPNTEAVDEALSQSQQSWETYNREIDEQAAQTWESVASGLTSQIGGALAQMAEESDSFWGRTVATGLDLFTEMLQEQIRRHAQAQVQMQANERAAGGSPANDNDPGSSLGGGGTGSAGASGASLGGGIFAIWLQEFIRFNQNMSAQRAANSFAGSIRVTDQGTSFDNNLRVSQQQAQEISSGIQAVLDSLENATGGFAAALPDIALAVSKDGEHFKVHVGAAAVRFFDDINEAVAFAASEAFRQGNVTGIGDNVRRLLGTRDFTPEDVSAARLLDSPAQSGQADAWASFNDLMRQVKEVVDRAGLSTSDYVDLKNKEISALEESARGQLNGIAGISSFGSSLRDAVEAARAYNQGLESQRQAYLSDIATGQQRVNSLREGIGAQQGFTREQLNAARRLTQTQVAFGDLALAANNITDSARDSGIALVEAASQQSDAFGTATQSFRHTAFVFGEAARDTEGKTADMVNDLRLGGDALASLGRDGIRPTVGELGIAEGALEDFQRGLREIPEAIDESEINRAVEGAFAGLLSDLFEITQSEQARQELVRITAQLEIASLQLRAEELLALNRLTQAQVDLLNNLLGQATTSLQSGQPVRRPRRGGGGRSSREQDRQQARGQLEDLLRSIEDADLSDTQRAFQSLTEEMDRARELAARLRGEERQLAEDRILFAEELGRNRIFEDLVDQLRPLLAGQRGLDDVSRAVAGIDELLAGLREAGAGERQLARWRRRAMRQIADDIKATAAGFIGDESFAIRQNLLDFEEFIRNARDNMSELPGITEQVISEWEEAFRADQAQGLYLQLAEHLLESEELAQLKFNIEVAGYRQQVALFEEMGIITSDIADEWRGMIDEIESRGPGGGAANDNDGFRGGLPGGGFPGGGSPAESADEEAQRLLDAILQMQQAGESGLPGIVAGFEEMRASLTRLRPALRRMGVDFEELMEQLAQLESAQIAEFWDQELGQWEQDTAQTFQDRFAALNSQFDEYLRLAQEHGGDMLRIEEARAEAQRQLWEENYQSLRDFIDEARGGDQFGGLSPQQQIAAGNVAFQEALASGDADQIEEALQDLLNDYLSYFGDTAEFRYYRDLLLAQAEASIPSLPGGGFGDTGGGFDPKPFPTGLPDGLPNGLPSGPGGFGDVLTLPTLVPPSDTGQRLAQQQQISELQGIRVAVERLEAGLLAIQGEASSIARLTDRGNRDRRSQTIQIEKIPGKQLRAGGIRG